MSSNDWIDLLPIEELNARGIRHETCLCLLAGSRTVHDWRLQGPQNHAQFPLRGNQVYRRGQERPDGDSCGSPAAWLWLPQVRGKPRAPASGGDSWEGWQA